MSRTSAEREKKIKMMSRGDFEEIERMHAEWMRMEKAARAGWLMGERIRFNRLVNQFAQYIYNRGGFSNDDERVYARKLLEITETVDSEGQKVVNDLANEAFKELFRNLLR